MCVDQHGEHAERPVVFDKSHPSHVRSQIVNDPRIFQSPVAGAFLLQISLHVLNIRKELVPFVKWFAVHRSNICKSFLQKVCHKMPADESASSTNNNFVRFHTVSYVSTE